MTFRYGCGWLACVIAGVATFGYCAPGKSELSKTYSSYLKGALLERLETVEKAVQEYKKTEELDFQSAWIHLKLALDYIRLGRYEEAKKELRIAVDFKPEDAQSRLLLALLYTSLKEFKQAILQYETILQSKDSDVYPRYSVCKPLGLLYLYEGNLEKAFEALQRVLQADPQDAEAHLYLGTIYDEQGSRPKAIEEFQEALRLKPEFPEAMNALGYLYAEEGLNLEEAIRLIQGALAAEPDNGAYLDSLGWVFFKQGKTKEAIESLQKAAILIADPVIFGHLGQAYEQDGEYGKAIQYFKKALELDPRQEKIGQRLKALEGK